MLLNLFFGIASAQDSCSLVREVCVVTHSEFDLGFLRMSNPADVTHWVTDNGSVAVVHTPLVTGLTPGRCAVMTLNWCGETVKFNGYAANSTLWHRYFVGQCPQWTDTCAMGNVLIDATIDGVISAGAVLATPCSDSHDLCWTDN